MTIHVTWQSALGVIGSVVVAAGVIGVAVFFFGLWRWGK